MLIHNQRLTANLDGDFVVFLIGARINRWWKIHKWLPVARAMGRMLRELHEHPELGFLGAETFGGRTTCMVQYWRSVDHLMSYARSRDAEHLPAWHAFNRRIGQSGDVGIWHETYVVEPGRYETIYNNMPAFGLGRAGQLTPVGRHGARERIERSRGGPLAA